MAREVLGVKGNCLGKSWVWLLGKGGLELGGQWMGVEVEVEVDYGCLARGLHEIVTSRLWHTCLLCNVRW